MGDATVFQTTLLTVYLCGLPSCFVSFSLDILNNHKINKQLSLTLDSGGAVTSVHTSICLECCCQGTENCPSPFPSIYSAFLSTVFIHFKTVIKGKMMQKD